MVEAARILPLYFLLFVKGDRKGWSEVSIIKLAYLNILSVASLVCDVRLSKKRLFNL